MNNKLKSVCFSGHRESKLPKSELRYGAMIASLDQSLELVVNNGYSIFYTGLCSGFDLIAAEKVLAIKDHDITLIGVVPFRGQEDEWSTETQEIYRDVSRKCHELVVLNEKKVRGCYYQRNRYMVDRSSVLICYCSNKQGGTAYTLNYANKQGLTIDNLSKK